MFSRILRNNKAKAPSFTAEYIALEAEHALASTPEFTGILSKITSTDIRHGQHGQKRSGSGSDFWQYREYREGDAAHSIDWRKSARSDGYFVKEQEWQKSQQVSIWFSHDHSMDFKHSDSPLTKKQYAAIISYILCAKFVHAGETVSFLNGYIKNCNGAAKLNNLAHSLTSTNPPLNSQQFGLKNAYPVLIADFWEKPHLIEDKIKNLTANNYCGLILQIIDPAELDLPYKGRVKLTDEYSDHEDTGILNKIENIRDEYKQRILAHNKLVQEIAHKYGCQYICVDTHSPMSEACMNIYQAITHGSSEKGSAS